MIVLAGGKLFVNSFGNCRVVDRENSHFAQLVHVAVLRFCKKRFLQIIYKVPAKRIDLVFELWHNRVGSAFSLKVISPEVPLAK